MSQHIGLPLKSPLKKSLRSREEIRKFVEEQIKEEKPEEIYADQRALDDEQAKTLAAIANERPPGDA